MLNVVMLNDIMLSVGMLNVVVHAECRYAECRYAYCLGALKGKFTNLASLLKLALDGTLDSTENGSFLEKDVKTL
jgi:hypothetical protein